jgi:hypothetical protein
MMTMRKRLRRRSAVRELLQKLVTLPFCEDAPRTSGGMSSVPRPVLVHASRAGEERRARGYSHD